MNRTDGGGSRDLLYGFGGGCVSYPTSVVTIETSRYFFGKWGLPSDKFLLSKNFDWLYRSIGAIQSCFLRGALKTFLIGYLVIAVPILEEWVFRGKLYSYQESRLSSSVCILTNAAAFGAIHLSYFHGIASVPYFLVATISGVIYACIREWTGSWQAPAIAHGISNAFVIAFETMR